MDFVYCALIAGFAAALMGFVALCDAVGRRP